MKVLYPYNSYPEGKKAIYFIDGNDYNSDSSKGETGWNKILKEAVVIGEDEHCYITELREAKICNKSRPDYGETVLLPLGFHKSRLIKWKYIPGEQLSLFE